MSKSIHSLLSEMQKSAGLESMNPPTSHESGGKPDAVTDVSTGPLFAEQSAADKDRPGATAEDNKVTGSTPDENPTVPTTTKATGEDPENEKNVTGDIKDKNPTTHPANGNIGEKYSAGDDLSKAAQIINDLVSASKDRLAKLASGDASEEESTEETDKTASDSDEEGSDELVKLSGDELTANNALVEQIKEATDNEALAEFYRGKTSQEVAEMQKRAYQMVAEARGHGDKLASLLADCYDQEKAAMAKKAGVAKKPNNGGNSAALGFFDQLKKAMEEEDMEEEEGGSEEMLPDGASMGGGEDMGVEMGGDMGGDMGGEMGGAEMGGMVSPEEMGGMGGEDMGGAGIDPEILAMLEQIAAQAGVSVEELIMALASKEATAAVQAANQKPVQSKQASAKVDTKSAAYKNLDKLCKDALAAVTDIVDRGKCA